MKTQRSEILAWIERQKEMVGFAKEELEIYPVNDEFLGGSIYFTNRSYRALLEERIQCLNCVIDELKWLIEDTDTIPLFPDMVTDTRGWRDM
jgi:hypothetical protein